MTSVLVPAFVVSGVCLLMEMFFAASELAVISCDRIALRKDAQAGHHAARLLERFLSNKQRFLATTLVGSQFSVVVSTVFMTYALHRYDPHRAELYLLDTGHFALEDQGDEIARLMRDFLGRVLPRS